eukprot:14995817-Alexandrium_andersonii.AAC.1
MYSKGARTLGQRGGQTLDCDKACARASGKPSSMAEVTGAGQRASMTACMGGGCTAAQMRGPTMELH